MASTKEALQLDLALPEDVVLADGGFVVVLAKRLADAFVGPADDHAPRAADVNREILEADYVGDNERHRPDYSPVER